MRQRRGKKTYQKRIENVLKTIKIGCRKQVDVSACRIWEKNGKKTEKRLKNGKFQFSDKNDKKTVEND